MDCKEKAQATYEAIQAMKNDKVLVNQQVAKLAKNGDKEFTEYRIGKVNHLRRRNR